MIDEFYICIFSQFGPTYQFRLLDTRAYYHFSTQKFILEKEDIPPLEHQGSKADVDDFWWEIEQIDIAHWQEEYQNQAIPDGPCWQIEWFRGNKEGKSQGTSAFPNSPNPCYSPEFIKLIQAVRKLLNWMPFG
jgi:hypothetical protein